jgi:hypothetical protein
MKNVLLICPNFFGYEKRIAEAFTQLGWSVDYLDERPSNHWLFKVIQRLSFIFTKKIVFNYYSKWLKNIPDDKYQLVFCVNIESIDKDVLSLISQKFPNAKRILYMWDGIINKPRYIHLTDYFHKCCSFDPLDCAANKGLVFHPLFYSKLLDKNNKLDIEYDFSFIGTVHGDRLRILKALEKQALANGKKVYFYFYYPNKLLFLLRCLFSKDVTFNDIERVSFVPLDYAAMHTIILQSACVIDIHHESQTGLTMRTIEVLGTGTRVMTTNSMTSNMPFTDDGSLIVFDRINPILPEIDHSTGKIYNEYFINNWLENILEHSDE